MSPENMAEQGGIRIAVGNVVRCVHGGPAMTVNWVSFDGQVTAVWFDSSNAIHEQVFSPQALVKANGCVNGELTFPSLFSFRRLYETETVTK